MKSQRRAVAADSEPRSTLTEAAGSSNTVSGPALTTERAGGPSGSARPARPLARHWYCALPKVIVVVAPLNTRSARASLIVEHDADTMWVELVLVEASSDHWPSGRSSA